MRPIKAFGFPVAPSTEFTEAEIENSLREAVRWIQNNYRYAIKRGWLQETRKTFPGTLRQLAKSLEGEPAVAELRQQLKKGRN